MRDVILSWMRCAGPAYQRTNTYRVHRSVLNSYCWIPAGVWEMVINMFVTARLIHCDTNSWKERSVGREPLCGISQSPICSQRRTRSRLRIWARQLVLSCRHPDKPVPRWHLLCYRYVMDHFSQPCWSGLFIIICSGVISWTWENCLPQCQEFLVTVQSDSRRRLRIRLIAFLKAAPATARHSRLNHWVKSQELQLKLVVWYLSEWPLSKEVLDSSSFHLPQL